MGVPVAMTLILTFIQVVKIPCQFTHNVMHVTAAAACFIASFPGRVGTLLYNHETGLRPNYPMYSGTAHQLRVQGTKPLMSPLPDYRPSTKALSLGALVEGQ